MELFSLTSMSTFVTICVAMSMQPCWRALGGRSASLYQLRLTECAQAAAGEACCTRVVVTIPTDLPGTVQEHTRVRNSSDINKINTLGMRLFQCHWLKLCHKFIQKCFCSVLNGCSHSCSLFWPTQEARLQKQKIRVRFHHRTFYSAPTAMKK